MKKIHLTVGLPRSGKTTWARKQNVPIINPDSIRLALHGKRFEPLAEGFVWAITYVMVRALLLAGHDIVVVDATNITQKRRRLWIQTFQNPDCEVLFHFMATSKAKCIKRAEAINDKEIIPIIEKMAEQFEPFGEGLDVKNLWEQINKKDSLY